MEPIVTIKDGALKGRKVVTKAGKQYFSFQGIPYAKPPIGNLRFKAPQPPDPWTGIKDALKEGAICPQLDDNYTYIGDENCLFLNVYTPQLPGEKNSLPVMVWIHGGAYITGSGNSDKFGPDYLIEQDIVLVTLNYRLAALGFLDTEDGEVTPNCGMRDQVSALKWVNDNISVFGGIPDNITIFGESAGATSVQLLLLSDMTKGLYSRSISQSGSSLNPWPIKISPRDIAFKLGQHLGLSTSNSNELITFLRTVDSERIVNAVKILSNEAGYSVLLFVPSIEKEDYGEGIFLSESPLNLIQQGKFHKVPQICGCNSSEGLMYMAGVAKDPDYLNKVDKNITRLVPGDVIADDDSKQKLAQQIKEFYFGKNHISLNTKANFIDYTTDIMFTYGTNKAVSLFPIHSTAPTYYYIFTFDGILGLLKKRLGDLANGIPGPSHGDEVPYIFNNINSPEVENNSSEAKVRNILVKMWTNFAKTGNPTPSDEPPIGVKWVPVSAEQQHHLNINTELKMEDAFTSERFYFWDRFYDNE